MQSQKKNIPGRLNLGKGVGSMNHWWRRENHREAGGASSWGRHYRLGVRAKGYEKRLQGRRHRNDCQHGLNCLSARLYVKNFTDSISLLSYSEGEMLASFSR